MDKTGILKMNDNLISGFHPGHLVNLRKSGLSDETILEAGIKSVRPGDISKETGINNQNITSALRIPYFDMDGNTLFSQYKIFPSIVDKEGREIKYIQPKGTQARPYILPRIWGVEDKPNKPLWLSEGAKKCLKLIQHVEYAISFSGVWNFKAGKDSVFDDEKDLWSELKKFAWKGRIVYLAFDADLWVNTQVRRALYELSLRLYNEGAIIKIVTWELSKGKGIDDFLVYHESKGEKAEDVLEALKKNSSSLENFFNSDHTDEILRALATVDLEPLRFEQILSVVTKKLKIKEKTVKVEIQKRKEFRQKENDITGEERCQALELLKNPDIIGKYLETCHTRYLGRDDELVLLKLACMSRKFKRGVNVVLSGTSSVGKSELVGTVLETVWGDDREDFTRISGNYLLYRKNPLDHKIITFFEISGSRETAYIVRTAITEGRLKLGTVVDDPQKGLISVDIDKPTDGLVVISTFASGQLDWELSTRVIKIEIAHNEILARNVLRFKATPHTNEKAIPFRIWQVADKILEPYEVDIPFADKLAERFPVNEERFMRDFDKVLSLIRASALLHQYQRGKTNEGHIIATESDYKLVFGLRNLISESVSPIPEPLINFLKTIQKINSEPTREEIAKITKKSDKTIKRYIDLAQSNELITAEGKGRNQKIRIIEIPELISPLPKPEKIFSISGVQLSNFPESLDSLGKELDNPVCPVMSNLSDFKSEHPETGQIGHDRTNAVVQCKPIADKDLNQIGQTDTEKTGKISNPEIDYSNTEVII